MIEYLKRLKSPATVLGIVGYVVTILLTTGVEVDNNAIMTVAQSVCSILVLLGIMNNPETEGIDLPVKKEDK